MMAKQTKDDFVIVSYNVNGLQNSKKRRDIFDFLRNKLKGSVYLLQECHWTLDSEDFIRACWGYNLWLAGKDTNRNGVAILFRNNFEYKVHGVHRDAEGCYILMDVEILKKRMTLANVYGPSSGDNVQFFDKVCELIDVIGNESVIIGGDWNCVLDEKIDTVNYVNALHRPQIKKKILEMLVNYDLMDVWREMNPTTRAYTWRRPNTTKQGRLDYFLISRNLVVDVLNVSIDVKYRSDHAPVLLGLRKEKFKRDRPFWRHNNSLLKDPKYLEEIRKVIMQVKKQYALPVYNYDNIGDVPPDMLQFTISDQLFFEMLLLGIREKVLSYSSFIKKTNEEKEKVLLQQIKNLEKSVTEDSLQTLERAKNELEELRNIKMEGIAVRSRVTWLLEGEKSTRYFCNLENRNFVNKMMTCIDKGDVIIDNQEGILKEVKEFYCNLYAYKQVSNVDLETLLPDVPVVPDEDHVTLEGPITFQEASEVLKDMKNFKSPGMDGFSVEFYKMFFSEIGAFLVRSANEGFEKVELSQTQKMGVITCIPKEGKEKEKQYIRHWRPISLLNVSYKIISACIARRVRSVLPNIIHESQKGFMSGRYIGECIRTVYDIMSYTEMMSIPGLIVAVDFEKAFDSVSWNFIEKCLRFFRFPSSIIQWFKTLYANPSSCVYLNGQYSSWFPLQRGCRQGDPISPYLYLIVAEILSLLLRKNENVKGIRIGNYETLLRQFADDTTVFLDGSEKSFRETIGILDTFALMSGLKINNEKTQILWIGSQKRCGSKYMRDRNFVWDPGTVKILGVIFSVDMEHMVRLNYNGKLEEIRRTLARWRRRKLTPYGKVTVIKTLVISQLTYLFLNVPDPSKEFLQDLEKSIFSFLWDGKPAKIKKSLVCHPKNEGGLEMLDLNAYLASMKLSWLRRLNDDNQWVTFSYSLYPRFADIVKYGDEYCDLLIRNCHNHFWIDVFKWYKKFYRKCTPQNEIDLVGVPIHYNSNILRGRRMIVLQEWADAGVLQVKDLLDQQGRFMSFVDFGNCYPTVTRTNFLVHFGVIQAVQHYQIRLGLGLKPFNGKLDSTVWSCIYAGNKMVQNKMKKNDIIPTSLPKWSRRFPDMNWNKVFEKAYKSTKDNQLRWFQLRLLHRIMPTKKYLYHRKVKESATCTFCNQEDQTIEHLFWDCPAVKMFWDDFLQWLHDSCEHTLRFMLTEELILFGISERIVTDHVIDFILLVAKFFVYSCTFQDTRPTLRNFVQVLKFRYKIEKSAAIRNAKMGKFELNWMPYMPLLS